MLRLELALRLEFLLCLDVIMFLGNISRQQTNMQCAVLNGSLYVYGGIKVGSLGYAERTQLYALNLTTFRWKKLADHSDKR